MRVNHERERIADALEQSRLGRCVRKAVYKDPVSKGRLVAAKQKKAFWPSEGEDDEP